MQNIRGTKDILPDEIQTWQNLYKQALEIFNLYNYYEVRTPIIEPTELFLRSIGNTTDIINKEMYTFIDQGNRKVTLRPEGTACIARAFISNRLYEKNQIQRLWYMGPMFRYERPQHGRQRQFHQLGVECIGSNNILADIEVIKIADTILKELQCPEYKFEINSIGNKYEREKYKKELVEYITLYKDELDFDSQKRLKNNPLRILDSKNKKTIAILENAPCISKYLEKESQKNFELVCESLNVLQVPYKINTKLVRGLDYYNYTTFEITNNNQQAICGGGRYNNLIKELGGPDTPAVGWAIGIERLLLLIDQKDKHTQYKSRFYIITQGDKAKIKVWDLIHKLEIYKIQFSLDLSNRSFQKQIKKAIQYSSECCLILGDQEIVNNTITIKWLKEHYQETIPYTNIITYIQSKSPNKT